MNVLIYSFAFLGVFSCAYALYFHIGETERKCFIEEIPGETTVLGVGLGRIIISGAYAYVCGHPLIVLYVLPNCPKLLFTFECRFSINLTVNYKVEVHDPRSGGFMPSTPGIGMHVEIKDADAKVILSRVYSFEGRISFTSHTPGEHVLCLYSNSTKWIGGTQLRVHLDIQVGEHAIDYANVAQKEKLTELQLRVRQVLDQVEQITKEQNYQRYREERFRATSESTNQRVFWWSLAQLGILLSMGVWQMRHLKSFFEAKKLV